MKKNVAVLAGAWACALPLSWAFAQGAGSYPDHPVRIIEPHSPGALVDTVTRYIAQNLAQKWGQPVVVENKPGANQAIGAELVAKSDPDGYTLLVGTQTGLVFNAIARKNLPFDPVKDFAPITGLFDTPFYFVVNPKLPVKNVKELIALAKSKPGKLTYASIGIGSSHQLAAEMFKTMTGTDILHVAYKGSGPAMTDVLGGQVDMMFEGGGSSLPNVRSGKLRALASTGSHRTEDMPDLPTLAETVPGYNLSVWIGMVAPAGTPKAIIDKINRDTVEILKRPETHKHFAGIGIEMMPTTTDELGRLLKDEFPKWTKVMRDAGIEAQ